MKTNDKIIAVMRFMILGLLLALTACSEEWISGNTPTTEGGRVLSVNIDLPDAKPGFSETDLRSTTESSWNNGDELLMELQLLDENSTIKFTEGLTLIYNEGDWTVPATSKLITDETLSLSGNLTLRIPESVTEEVTAKVELYYAPECTWVDNNLALKTTAMTTAPEKWQFDVESWATSAARLRIHTGVEEDVVKLTSAGFAGAFGNQAGTYTATTDASGNAYFYGTMAKATSGFTVSVEVETTLDDGSTVSVDMPVLEASPLVPVTLTAGECYRVDAKEKRDKAAAVLNALLEDHPDGYEIVNDTYEVYTYKGLMEWRNSEYVFSTSVKLMANITLPTTGITMNEETGQPSGSNWTPVGDSDNPYTGTFDGNGYTISGLRISSTSDYTGLVGFLESGTVKNLTMSDAVVYSTAYSTGGIVGYNLEGTVSGCTVSGSVTGEDVTGGIVGVNRNGIVSGCTVSGSVTGLYSIGGIVGDHFSGIVSGSTVSGSVTGVNATGGIVGNLYDSFSIVMACGNTATVAGNNDVGGIVGCIGPGTVTGCWTSDTQENNSPDPDITEDKDGIGGMNSNATATACYSGNQETINAAVEAMNTAIGTTVTWKWQAGTNGSWPTLTTSD